MRPLASFCMRQAEGSQNNSLSCVNEKWTATFEKVACPLFASRITSSMMRAMRDMAGYYCGGEGKAI